MYHRQSHSRYGPNRGRFGGPLLRRPQDGWLAGVCAAISHRFGISLMPLRIAVAISALIFTTPVVILYVCAWLFLDTEQEHWEKRCDAPRG